MNRQYEVILPTLCWGRRYQDFYAVTVDVSRRGLRLTSSNVVEAGDELACNISHVGLVDVRVKCVQGHLFTTRVQARQNAVIDINRKLLSLSRQQAIGSRIDGGTRYVVPFQRFVQIVLENGSSISGRIINVSTASVAFIVDQELQLGASVIVGATQAKVSGYLNGGIKASFIRRLDHRTLHKRMIL